MKDWLNQTPVLWGIALPFTPLQFLLQFLLPVIGFIVISSLLALSIKRVCNRFIKVESRHKAIIRWTRRILRIFVFMAVLLSLGSLWGLNGYDALGDVFRILNAPFFSSGKTRISVITLLLFIPVVMISAWLGRIVKKGLESGMLMHFGLNEDQEFTVSRLIRFMAMTIIFFFGLSIIGIDFTTIGVFLGILGVGIGFGLQSLIADFFAGLSLIGMGLVKEGDRIRIGEHDGVIKHVRMLNTELTTYENETLLIPNRHLTGEVIHSYNYKDRRIVIINTVEVSYDSDLDEVIRILYEVAERNPWRHADSKILVWTRAFEASGISMEMRTWINDVIDKGNALSWTNTEIWRSFKAADIQIPFPQMVVHQA